MSATHPLPIIFLIHPVGIGATRALNVLSAKLWPRALVDLLSDVTCQGTVGGEFNHVTRAE